MNADQKPLFSDNSDGAVFSQCQKYRYLLWRSTGQKGGTVLFIMLNPSTATDVTNDPTVTKCIERARRMGYGRMQVVNIFAYRSTDPQQLYKVMDPVGPENDSFILQIASKAEKVICGWGGHGELRERGKQVIELLLKNGIELYCLSWTAKGQPGHPLYLSYEIEPRPLT